MKFSLATLLTVTGFVAWCLAASQMQVALRQIFVPTSLLMVIVALFVTAMILPRDSNGKLDYENSYFLDALEPTFKISLAVVAIAFVVILAAICYGIYAIMTF